MRAQAAGMCANCYLVEVLLATSSRIIILNDVIWNDVGRDVASCVYDY
jgi:hypothetical protein